MDDLTIARIVHVLAIVLWIGGVGLVTTVLLPAVRGFKSPAEQAGFFALVEHRFGRQARLTTLLAGASGFYMVYRLDAWHRFASLDAWWMHAMVGVWLLFTLVLFVAEPLFLHRWFAARAAVAPAATLRLVQRLHWLLLALSLAAVAGAVAGSHGLI
jgi:uncharacterized membrane protein